MADIKLGNLLYKDNTAPVDDSNPVSTKDEQAKDKLDELKSELQSVDGKVATETTLEQIDQRLQTLEDTVDENGNQKVAQYGNIVEEFYTSIQVEPGQNYEVFVDKHISKYIQVYVTMSILSSGDQDMFKEGLATIGYVTSRTEANYNADNRILQDRYSGDQLLYTDTGNPQTLQTEKILNAGSFARLQIINNSDGTENERTIEIQSLSFRGVVV